MTAERLTGDDAPANAEEGADPSADIKAQNPGGTTTADLATRATGEGTDSAPAKAEDLAKAGREDFDPNEENPA